MSTKRKKKRRPRQCRRKNFKEFAERNANLTNNCENRFFWTFKEYKLQRGCKICGYNTCSTALEFHHLDKKIKCFTLSNRVRRTYQEIKEEIDKCIIVCSNHHHELEEGLINLGLE